MDQEIRDLERRAALGDEVAKAKLAEKYKKAGQLKEWSVIRLPLVDRRRITEAIYVDHLCENQDCDITAALDAGFEEVAAHLLLGATDAPALEDVLEEHQLDIYGTNFFGAPYPWPRDWGDWVIYHRENTVECPACGAFNFLDEFGDLETCANCLEPLIF